MGLVCADVEVLANLKSDVSFTKPFLVDTGATDTVIPSDELEKIGIARVGKREYELADGSIVLYDVGIAVIRVSGDIVAANVVFGERGTEPLIGVTVLQSAGIVVDPAHHTLRKISAIPLK